MCMGVLKPVTEHSGLWQLLKRLCLSMKQVIQQGQECHGPLWKAKCMSWISPAESFCSLGGKGHYLKI